MITFASWNLRNYGTDNTADECVRSVIRTLSADVVAVQEIIASGEDAHVRAGERLRELADAAGLCCELPDGQVAVGLGSQRFHVGMLWRDGLRPVGTARVERGWHALLTLDLDVGAPVPVRHASYHGPPFGRHRRADEAERVAARLTSGPPGMVAADWNALSADRGPEGAAYDADPYADAGWHPVFIHQACWSVDREGRWTWWADRAPGEVLVGGGLVDAAAALAVPWQPTTGHDPDDPHPPRRIDRVHVNAGLRAALRSHEVVDIAAARDASDHLPVVVGYDPTAIC